MEVKFILDFDGVLFNSAFEAFSVCQFAAREQPGLRQDVDFDAFMAFRPAVTDAWQYHRLYSDSSAVAPDGLASIAPDAADWAFAKRFFAARAEMMADPEWAKVMPPYPFFAKLKPVMLAHPDRFAILSTRNVESIRRTLAWHGVDGIAIFGQEHVREQGGKLGVAKAQGWCDRERHMALYLDDMTGHLAPFEGQVLLPLHADWGYDAATASSISQGQAMRIITSLLVLAQQVPEARWQGIAA